MSASKPNIILINCDDLGYGDLGCYGSPVNKTPHIDRLAREGMKFTDFYMASPLCSPSRGAMLTGCYPPRIGFGEFESMHVLFPGQPCGLNPDEKTIASQLKNTGYATKIIGKWHCGDQQEFLPTNFGFDEYFGIPYSNDMGRQANYLPQFFPPLPLMRNIEVAQEQPDQRALTERYTTEACGFIQDNKDEPFFLYFAHMHVHVPIFVPKNFLDNSENGGYGAAVEEIDWSTGMLMDKLEQLGLSKNTLIIFTSDNGSRARGEGGSNGTCRGHKGQTWDGGLRVPCIMRWPDQIEAAQSNPEVSTAMDFFATLSHVSGAELPEDRVIDSKNIYPLMTDPAAKSETDCFGYYLRDALQAVRCGDWKLHVWREKSVVKELYNLRDDIGETTNVYDQHPDLVSEMEAKAQRLREDIGDTATGVEGANRRLKGVVENPRTLTIYREDHPYMIAEYDLADMPTMTG